MFGIGMSEAILILAIALIVIDPKKIPDLAKFIGRVLGEFKNATQDLKKSFNMDEDIGRFKTYDDIKDRIESAIDITPEISAKEKSDHIIETSLKEIHEDIRRDIKDE